MQRVRAKRKQTEALRQTLRPVSPAEEDILLATISAKYLESLPADLRLTPSTKVVKETIARMRTARNKESTWCKTVVVEFLKHPRAVRHQTDVNVQERILDMCPQEGDHGKREKVGDDVVSPGATKTAKGQRHAPDKSPRRPKHAPKAEDDPKRKDKLVVGRGKAEVPVQRLDNDRLKPMSITKINNVGPMDLY